MLHDNVILELLRNRRSIREYKPIKVEQYKIDQLIKVGLLSPTSRNFRPWEFIVVTNRKLLQELSNAKPHGAAFLKNSPLGIVVLGNQEKCDVWIEDASIASINMQLAAEALGLGSCWIQIRKRNHNDEHNAEQYVQKLLSIPENISVLSIISIGYPEKQRPSYTDDVLDYSKVHENTYS